MFCTVINQNQIDQIEPFAMDRAHDSRKRQWQTVGSSSEDDEGSKSDSGSSVESRDYEKHKDKKHKKEKKHKHEKKHKKDKHDKKDKKDKKDKRDKHHHSKSVNQNEYGKYGIIREEHLFQKQREFEAYMEEVKGIPGVMNESKKVIADHFKSFIEDYNTATMPHKKYYNYEMWEMIEYQKHQQTLSSSAKDDSFAFNNDEAAHRLERKRLKDEEERRAFAAVKDRLAKDKDQLDSMKRQSDIKLEMQMAYKRGDTETLKKLEQRLIPDKVETVAHPWH